MQNLKFIGPFKCKSISNTFHAYILYYTLCCTFYYIFCCRPSQPLPQQPPRSLHSSQSSLNRTDPQSLVSPVDRTRPVSTLVSPREQEQYANAMGYMHPNAAPPRSPKGSIDSHHSSQGSYPPRPLPDQR